MLDRECGCYSVDAYVPELRVAIEADGPSHFTQAAAVEVGGWPRATGGTLLKQRILERAGIGVLSVPFFEWEAAGCASDPGAATYYLHPRIARQAELAQARQHDPFF